MNGDVLSKCNFSELYQFGSQMNADLTVCIKELITPFRFGNIYFNGDYVTHIEEKPNIKTNILAGIYIMKPGIFEYIPYNEHLSMDTLMINMLNKNVPIAKYEIKDYWLDIGVIDDYQKVQEIYNNHFKDYI
jgi:NDP-sugar pyrophosphorylase family protein